jgi:CyaY protein
MISESEYVDLAQKELAQLVNVLDDIASDDLDCELENDILTLELSDDKIYVINSHRAARQIWMAAERKAWHFDWVPEKKAWIAEKTGEELWAMVRKVLSPYVSADAVETIRS